MGAFVQVQDSGWAVVRALYCIVRGGCCVLVLTEVGGISELTEACDWWSYGSLLYELLTGMVSSWVGDRAWWGPLDVGGAEISQPGSEERLPGSPCLTLGLDDLPPSRTAAIEEVTPITQGTLVSMNCVSWDNSRFMEKHAWPEV